MDDQATKTTRLYEVVCEFAGINLALGKDVKANGYEAARDSPTLGAANANDNNWGQDETNDYDVALPMAKLAPDGAAGKSFIGIDLGKIYLIRVIIFLPAGSCCGHNTKVNRFQLSLHLVRHIDIIGPKSICRKHPDCG